MRQPFSFDRKPRGREAKVNNTAMRPALMKDELAEVAVIRDKDAVFGMSKGNHREVHQTSLIVSGDGFDIVAEIGEKRMEA